MHEDPDQEWRRLSAHYGEMCDEELIELAAELKDLTDMAQQVLRDEMKRRGLEQSRPSVARATVVSNVPRKIYDILAGPLVNSYLVPSEDEPTVEEGP